MIQENGHSSNSSNGTNNQKNNTNGLLQIVNKQKTSQKGAKT